MYPDTIKHFASGSVLDIVPIEISSRQDHEADAFFDRITFKADRRQTFCKQAILSGIHVEDLVGFHAYCWKTSNERKAVGTMPTFATIGEEDQVRHRPMR